MARRRTVVLLATAALLLAACSRVPETPAPAAAPVRAALWKDPLSLSLIGNPDSNSEIVARLVTDSLVSLDASLRPVPQLARSWDLSDDRRTLTFHLREGVRWHDGAPFTADDVVFTWRKVMDPATQSKAFASDLEPVRQVDAVGPLTVRVAYETPDPAALLAWRVPIVPRHAAGAEPDLLHGSFAERPLGCGPFRLDAWERGQEIRLSAFPDYWDGAPAASAITLSILADDRTAWEALMGGELHLLALTPELARQAERDPRAAAFARKSYTPLRVTAIWWNTTSSMAPGLADARVRRAFSLALDRQGFIDSVVGKEIGLPAATLWHPDLPFADPDVRALRQDLAGAAALLEEAGWSDRDGDGVRERAGRPLALTLLSPTSAQAMTQRTAEWVQAGLASVGARVQLKQLEWAAYQERRVGGEFDAAVATIAFDPNPDLSTLLASDRTRGLMNYGRFADPETDHLLQEIRTGMDEGARRAACARLQRRLQEEEPVTALYHTRALLLLPRSLQGVETSAVGLYAFTPGPRAWHWSAAASPSRPR
jgi:peptide/nickel transport system substrate-binding protein